MQSYICLSVREIRTAVNTFRHTLVRSKHRKVYMYIYSGFASNVDFPIVVLIVFGGSASKVTCLFAKKEIPSKAYATDGKRDKLAYDFQKFTSKT